jgi:hypothetical protein
MATAQPSLTSLAELTGWTEGQILAFCGTVIAAGCATAAIAAIRAADVVNTALPRSPQPRRKA